VRANAQPATNGFLDSLPKPLAEFIAAQPGMRKQLLQEHVDDGSGHCEKCGGGGQTGRYIWPCTIRLAALAGSVTS
jgi:hypothetical protein